jgi:hypothetical protein
VQLRGAQRYVARIGSGFEVFCGAEPAISRAVFHEQPIVGVQPHVQAIDHDVQMPPVGRVWPAQFMEPPVVRIGLDAQDLTDLPDRLTAHLLVQRRHVLVLGVLALAHRIQILDNAADFSLDHVPPYSPCIGLPSVRS